MNSVVRTRRVANLLAGVVSIVMIVLVPSLYMALENKYIKGNLDSEVVINSRIISRLINSNPEMWQFETLRLNEILSYRPQSGEKEIRRILDNKNNIVAESVDAISSPFIKKSYDLKESGVTVGKIEIYRSWIPVFWKAFSVFIGGMLIAVLTFFAIRILPFRTLIRVQEEQRRNEELVKQLLQTTDQGIYGVNSDGNCTFINKSGAATLGYKSQYCHGKNMHKLVHHSYQSGEPFPVEDCHICRVKQSGEHCRLDNEVLWKSDGSYFHAEYSAYAIFDNDKITGTVVTFSDISERKQAEEHRAELEAQLRQKHKMETVGFMAGGMAHNFNNNLSIILGNVELSQMKQSPDSEVIPLLENAKIAVRRSRDLVQKIITYSRQGIQKKAPVHLTEIADETISLLASTLPSTIVLQKIYSSDSSATVINADDSQIQEVLINLSNNAVQAMDEKGEMTIRLEPVELNQSDIPAQFDCLPGPYAKLSVEDSGCGMPAEMLDKIFDPFYTTKDAYEGAGMGLSTVQGIVAQHGGFITVNSVPDKGTTFNLYFPILNNWI